MMNRLAWTVLIPWALLASFGCDFGKPKTQPSDLSARHELTPESFAGIEAAQTDISEMGDMEKPMFFRTVVVDEEKTPGALPRADAGVLDGDPADYSIRQIVYGARAAEDIKRIHGFRIVRQSPPRIVPGYAHKPLSRIRVTLEIGPTEAVRFGMDGPPELPDSPPALGYQLPPEEAEAETETDKADSLPEQAEAEQGQPATPEPEPDPKDDADPSDALTRVFQRDFLLQRDPNKTQFWRFEPPLEVAIPFGTGMQLTVEYLDPYLYPTQPIFQAGDVQVAIPDRYRELASIHTVPPLEERRASACMGSPRGQLICLYTSGVAELYVEAPFTEPLVGSWHRQTHTLNVELEERSWRFDTSDTSVPLDFGVYGTGFVHQLQGDERLHPFFDLARELAGDTPFSVEGIGRIFHVQVDQKGEPEVVAELKTGGFAVLQRQDRYSPYRLMKRVDLAGASLKVLTTPMTGRGFVATKSPGDELWKVYAYNATEAVWSHFPRREVPWKPWERGETIHTTPIVWEQPPDFVPDTPPDRSDDGEPPPDAPDTVEDTPPSP